MAKKAKILSKQFNQQADIKNLQSLSDPLNKFGGSQRNCYAEKMQLYEKMYHESKQSGDFESAKCWRAMVEDLRNYPFDHI